MDHRVYRKALDKVLRRKKLARCDFHMHTFLSDGVLLPMELIRRCGVKGYTAVALTDHVSYSNFETVIKSLHRDCEVACEEMDILALPGVELTHVPPRRIGELARLCRNAGALVVVVHGETMMEPVAEGTNEAGAGSADVDILAHPGNISKAVCTAARKNGVFLEITSRGGHNRTNGHVFKTGKEAGCSFLINTDSHTPSDIIDEGHAAVVGSGSGMGKADLNTASQKNARTLLERVRTRI